MTPGVHSELTGARMALARFEESLEAGELDRAHGALSDATARIRAIARLLVLAEEGEGS